MNRYADIKQKLNLAAEAASLKVLSDPTRLRLAVLLSPNGETCVCTLARILAEPEYKISHHLALMRSAGLVTARRDGTWMYYKLSRPRNHVEEYLWRCFRDYLMDDGSIATLKKLRALSRTEEGRK